jgi:peptide/nickel transport system substrate-binding protein
MSIGRRMLLAAGVAGAVAPAAPRLAYSQNSRPLSIALPVDPGSLDPMFRDGGIEGTIQRHIFDTLVHRAPDMSLRPWLAQSVEQIDGTTWRVRLREGAVFSNGEAADADAVRFSLARIMNPENRSTIRTQIAPLGRVEPEGATAMVFRLPQPDALFEARLTWLMIVPPKHTAEVGAQLTNQPIGSGPYLLRHWRRNAETALVENPRWWGAKRRFREVVFRTVPEELARLSALRTNEVQFAQSLSPTQVASLAGQAGFTVFRQPTSRVAVLNFNPRIRPADDPRFRRAVGMAVNRDEIMRGLIKELGVAVPTIFAPNVQGLPPGVTMEIAYRPDEARAMIDTLGLKGAEIEVGGPSARFPLDRELASVIAAQLRRVGLNARARVTEFGTYASDIKAGRIPPVFVQVHGNSWFDAVPQLDAFYHSNGLASPWADAETDRLLAASYAAPAGNRPAAIGAVMAHLRDQAMAVPLFNYLFLHGAAATLQWEPRADDFVFAFEMS